MKHVYNDGGRAASGYRGKTGDCVCRAIAIASGRPYAEIYARLAKETGAQRAGKRGGKRAASARSGITVTRKWFKEYMRELGFEWIPTMKISSGCKVHLREDELPMGRLVVSLSGHYAAVIDGVLLDIYDCSRDGTRCVEQSVQLTSGMPPPATRSRCCAGTRTPSFPPPSARTGRPLSTRTCR
jgi:hypothetical protein